jgi:hypothetical protein
MKKSIRIIALAMVAVMLCMTLISCGGPSGEYGSDDYSLKFSGSKFVVSYKGLTEQKELTGKFEMGKADDGSKTITFTMDETEGGGLLGDLANAAVKALFDGTKSYNSGKDDNGAFIEIGGARYYKK